MCNTGADETIEHLFFTCPLARQCWTLINFNWNLSLNMEDRIKDAKHRNSQHFFTWTALIAAWELWKIRDDKIFGRHDVCINRWVTNFKSQCHLQLIKFKADLRSAFCFWLDAFSVRLSELWLRPPYL